MHQYQSDELGSVVAAAVREAAGEGSEAKGSPHPVRQDPHHRGEQGPECKWHNVNKRAFKIEDHSGEYSCWISVFIGASHHDVVHHKIFKKHMPWSIVVCRGSGG